MKDLSSVNTEAPVFYREGEVLFAQGDNSRYLYIVKSGKVALIKANNNHLHIIKICGEKEILNEVSVLTKKPLDYSAVARSQVEVVLVEQKDILTVIKNSPDWVPEIFQTLCERLKSTEEMILEHNLQDSGDKTKDMILSKDESKVLFDIISKFKGK